jgi:serine/threonine protein kinase
MLADRYELGDRLGRGGMGDVWRAFDSVLRREVAVKTVDLDVADDSVTLERFQREAMATASLSHANVVTVFDAGIDGHTAYLVMELLPGPTLAALVNARGPLPVDQAVDYAAQAAAALSAAHAVGVVHRDIKPGNLMLDGEGRLKVVDFGIARLSQANAARLTATDTTVGSATFMSPEQARGEQATESSDVYALGCVLMTLLTGSPPFAAEQPIVVLGQHLREPTPRVSSRRPDVPPALDELVAAMLAKDPAGRPPDAEAVRSRLAALGASGPAQTAVMPAYVAPPPPTAVTQVASEPDGAKSNRGLIALVVLAAALLVVVAVWALSTLGDNQDSASSGPAKPHRTDHSSGGPTTQATSSTPTTSAPTTSAPTTSTPTTSAPTTTTPTTSTPTAPEIDPAVAGAASALRSSVESMDTSDESYAKTQEKLLQDQDRIDQDVAADDSDALARDVDHFSKTYEHAVDRAEISEDDAQQVGDALSSLQELLG